jgi:hypothetical protein
MYDAFISYSRSDLPTIMNLKEQIDKRHLRAFLDVDSLRAGQNWPPQLGAAVQKSRMMVLCWSERAAVSDWVRAEVNHSLSTRTPVPVLPWLLDSTPLPPMLGQMHGIRGTDPVPVVNLIAETRTVHQRRAGLALGAGSIVLAPALWVTLLVLARQSTDFHGHVVDEQGNAVAGAMIEAASAHATTATNGEFALKLPGPRSRRELQVTIKKPGYRLRTIRTQYDVPDLGVVLEKDR